MMRSYFWQEMLSNPKHAKETAFINRLISVSNISHVGSKVKCRRTDYSYIYCLRLQVVETNG